MSALNFFLFSDIQNRSGLIAHQSPVLTSTKAANPPNHNHPVFTCSTQAIRPITSLLKIFHLDQRHRQSRSREQMTFFESSMRPPHPFTRGSAAKIELFHPRRSRSRFHPFRKDLIGYLLKIRLIFTGLINLGESQGTVAIVYIFSSC